MKILFVAKHSSDKDPRKGRQGLFLGIPLPPSLVYVLFVRTTEVAKINTMYLSVSSLPFLVGCLSVLFRKADLEAKY